LTSHKYIEEFSSYQNHFNRYATIEEKDKLFLFNSLNSLLNFQLFDNSFNFLNIVKWSKESGEQTIVQKLYAKNSISNANSYYFLLFNSDKDNLNDKEQIRGFAETITDDSPS
jgi:hypothetical protein